MPAALRLIQPSWTSPETPAERQPAAAPAAKIELVSEIDELVARCQKGEPAAFRELFRTHRGDVARLVHRMLGHSPDLEDVIQEVFVQVHKSIRDFRGQARLSTWLYRVTVNVVLMHRRAARSRPIFVEAPETHPPCDVSPLPDEQVARRARIRAFNRLLDRLSEKKRTVFVLHELEGMAPVEIAKIVDAPVLTVRTRLFYARRELAEMLREEPALAALADELGAPIRDTDERAAARTAGRDGS
jgi:RNA polymerase sigma factor (sigma-70 family)